MTEESDTDNEGESALETARNQPDRTVSILIVRRAKSNSSGNHRT